jgi:hypothetical protein
MRTTYTATRAGSERHSPESGSTQPLPDCSKGFDVEHPVLDSLGLRRETLDRFGVGFFTGEGVLRDRVVLPFHDLEGRLVGYAGYSTEDRSIRYSQRFDPQRELYNVLRAQIAEPTYDGLVLVTELLNVLRLYELGVRRVVWLPTEAIHPPQLAQIRHLIGDGGRLDFVPWALEYSDNLCTFSQHFRVRLHRYYEGSENEFLAQVATSLVW